MCMMIEGGLSACSYRDYTTPSDPMQCIFVISLQVRYMDMADPEKKNPRPFDLGFRDN